MNPPQNKSYVYFQFIILAFGAALWGHFFAQTIGAYALTLPIIFGFFMRKQHLSKARNPIEIVSYIKAFLLLIFMFIVSAFTLFI